MDHNVTPSLEVEIPSDTPRKTTIELHELYLLLNIDQK